MGAPQKKKKSPARFFHKRLGVHVFTLCGSALTCSSALAQQEPLKLPLTENTLSHGVQQITAHRYRLGLVEFDSETKEISLPAEVNMPQGCVEYILVHNTGKVHESIFTTEANAQDIHLAMLLLGMSTENGRVQGIPLEIELEWNQRDGQTHRVRLLDILELGSGDPRKSPNEALAPFSWRYCGDAVDGNGPINIRYEGSLIALMKDPSALVNNVWIKQDPNNSSGSSDNQLLNENGIPVEKSNTHGTQSAKEHSLPNKGTPIFIKMSIYKAHQKSNTSSHSSN